MNRAEVVPDLLPRIVAAAGAVRDAEDARKLRTEQRNALIVKATDAGIPGRAIARAAGMSRSRVVAILISAGAVDELESSQA